jgi:hypothetical protein
VFFVFVVSSEDQWKNKYVKNISRVILVQICNKVFSCPFSLVSKNDYVVGHGLKGY